MDRGKKSLRIAALTDLMRSYNMSFVCEDRTTGVATYVAGYHNGSGDQYIIEIDHEGYTERWDGNDLEQHYEAKWE